MALLAHPGVCPMWQTSMQHNVYKHFNVYSCPATTAFLLSLYRLHSLLLPHCMNWFGHVHVQCISPSLVCSRSNTNRSPHYFTNFYSTVLVWSLQPNGMGYPVPPPQPVLLFYSLQVTVAVFMCCLFPPHKHMFFTVCPHSPFKVQSKEDGKLYAVKRSAEKFKGALDRLVWQGVTCICAVWWCKMVLCLTILQLPPDITHCWSLPEDVNTVLMWHHK